MQKITIRSLRQPLEDDINRDIEWFCESFGLLGPRDKNKTGLKLFKSMIEAARKEGEATVDELAMKAGVSRTAVIHHMRIMEDSGLVVREGAGFTLRMRSLQKVVDEINKDLERVLDSIKEIAQDIDRSKGLLLRKR